MLRHAVHPHFFPVFVISIGLLVAPARGADPDDAAAPLPTNSSSSRALGSILPAGTREEGPSPFASTVILRVLAATVVNSSVESGNQLRKAKTGAFREANRTSPALRDTPSRKRRQKRAPLTSSLLQLRRQGRRAGPGKPVETSAERGDDLMWGLPKIVWAIVVDVFAMICFLACIPFILNVAKVKRPALK